MPTTLIGVPPGVGDLYWCLTKLRAFKKQRGLEHVTLAIQKTSKDRAIEWASMVDFVEDARYVAFTPGRAALTGLEGKSGPLDFVMWPNAIVDRGIHLSKWLPELEYDDAFPVRTVQPYATAGTGEVVLYASARGVNRAWFPKRRPDFWHALAQELAQRFGHEPLLIGAGWDTDNPVNATHSLVGSTSLAEVAWILQHARAVVGVISGMTILANHFRVPCVAFAPDKHAPQFPYTWVRAREQPWYHVLRPVAMWHPAAAADWVARLVRYKEQKACNSSASSSDDSPARSS